MRRSHGILATALALAFANQGEAALNAYMRITSSRLGLIQGSVTQAGREGSILVHQANHDITVSVDAATGLPTGKRQHKPFTVTKPVDRSSPVLFSVLTAGEVLPTVEIKFWRPSPGGVEQQYYTIKLTNARIVGVKTIQPDTRDPTKTQYTEYEEISFVYQKIEWTWTDGSITHEDSWDSSRA